MAEVINLRQARKAARRQRASPGRRQPRPLWPHQGGKGRRCRTRGRPAATWMGTVGKETD
jgi:hypothetical protein